jgi:hypothetical protein
MKATIEVELQPFTVPDHVLAVAKEGLKQDGMKATPKYILSDLSSETLDQMCKDFRNEIFRKAGKDQAII